MMRRDLLLLSRHPGAWLNPLAFFALVITLFPIGISPSASLLSDLAPGLLWVAALLATLLSLDGLFRDDAEDGSLEQLLLSPQPLPLLILGRVAIHWASTGLPLALMAPLLGVMLSLPAESYLLLMVALALGSATLGLIGAIGAALTIGVARGGIILPLLVLPLYVPVLIFGSGALQAAIGGGNAAPHLAVLGALLALALMLAPWATAAALRISLNG
ncbi:heme exporter protein CcmB [Halomonas sp. 18H]|uniref:heme exporter protein CcmB n=1 Tax=Halomonas almeriensis TaxID=308163 RepID=UPI002231B58B|nr:MULTISPECIES: heme exporter protein CcmB [Halomonas]MCW4149670.1 heme exporter protein CcmB [Halomonas sp. 18H]MDN3553385.1 heme exporter protein CcmB [Halomonas almeriensis]